MSQVQKLKGQEIAAATPKPIDAFRNTLHSQKGEFQKVLPAHISFEKFQRTVMTALITQPELLSADRQSLLVSCIKAATDGLLPDSRDAALVIFNAKVKTQEGDTWIKKVQYLPMYAGILKKVRQSEELAGVVTHVVYKNDKFEYVLGDEEKIIHEPYMGGKDRGPIIAAYCIAKLKDGTVIREVMTYADIEKVRAVSKSGAMNENDLKYNKGAKIGDPKGIWKDWYEEMARKTVFRRAAKWLPQSIEIVERAFDNDETMEVLGNHTPDDPRTLDIVPTQPEEVSEDGEIKQPDLKKEIEKNQNPKAETPKDTQPAKDDSFPGDRPFPSEKKKSDQGNLV